MAYCSRKTAPTMFRPRGKSAGRRPAHKRRSLGIEPGATAGDHSLARSARPSLARAEKKAPAPPSLVRRVVGGPPAALERGKHKSHAASELPFELRRGLVFVSAPRGWELLPRPGSLLGRAKRKRAQTEREPVAICHLERAASSPSLLEAGVVIVGDRSR